MFLKINVWSIAIYLMAIKLGQSVSWEKKLETFEIQCYHNMLKIKRITSIAVLNKLREKSTFVYNICSMRQNDRKSSMPWESIKKRHKRWHWRSNQKKTKNEVYKAIYDRNVKDSYKEIKELSNIRDTSAVNHLNDWKLKESLM